MLPPRLRELLLWVCLASLPAFAAAPGPQPLDAFTSAPQRLGLRAQVEPGLVTSVEPRLGVPTFFWAPRELASARSLRDQGLTPKQASLRHLFTWAHLYGLTGAQLLEAATLVRLHDLGHGAIVASYEQRLAGVPVFRDRLNVVMNQQLELVAISGYFTPNAARAGFKLGADTALQVALADLSQRGVDPSQVHAAGIDQAGLQLFQLDPGAGVRVGDLARARQVQFNLPDALVPAWYVELDAGPVDATDTTLVAYVVSALDGRLLFRRELTEADAYTYRVWADGAPGWFPWDGPLGTEVTPHPTGTPNNFSPPFVASALRTLQSAPFSRGDPWLPPASTALTGNNVEAYADLVAPDGFNTGDLRAVASSASTFDYTYDPVVAAGASSTQRMAGLTQMFFDLNFLHDWFYDHGFDEAAGNAQTDNFLRGGAGADSIKGEAQDSSGINNANMSTPADGARPRMQMYLWRTSPPPVVSSTVGSFTAGTAAFGAQSFSFTAQVVLAVDGAAPTSDACSALVNGVTGKIVVIDRGTCSLAAKAQAAEQAGAVGVLIVNNVAGAAPSMGATTGITVTVPTLSLSQADGATLKAGLLAGTVTATMSRQASLDRDGDLDNGVVAHEWGHYLSNRLVSDGAGLGANQARGMGEGWSDFVALLMLVRASDTAIASNPSWSGTYAMAGYAVGSAPAGNEYYFGIRRYPYSTDFTKSPLTFKHIADANALPAGIPVLANGAVNSEVHNTGEVWAAMLWECYAAMLNAPRFTFTQARDRMQDELVASLKATPVDPTFVEARDAWLAVAAATDVRDYVTLGQAFARRGLGLFAVAPDRASTTNSPVVEDFATGNELVFASATLDDENAYCDHDGVLDVGEHGRLRLSFRNTGFGALAASSVTITSTTPGVTITPSTVSLSASSPQTLATGQADVVITGVTQPSRVDLQLAWADPALSTRPTPRTTTASFRVQTDMLPATSATDDVEATPTAWSFTHDAALSTHFDWARRELTPLQHAFFGVDPGATADLALVSPSLTVHATAPLVLTLSHRWAFEASGGVNYDGAVIEVSTNNGTTWTDVGAPAGYTGAIGQAAGSPSNNPLLGRQAYTGRSAGYPAFVTTTINLGTTYAGQSLKVRFRIGADQATTDVGWDLDSIGFSGVTNTPFPTLVADRALCLNRPPVANAGPDLTVDERTPVTLDSSRSTDPDNNPLTARWTQTAGAPVTLTGATFTAPDVTANADLAFDLVVNDGSVDSLADTVVVHVRNVNRAPTVDAGTALSVPERSAATVSAVGVDPDADPLTWTWSQVSGPALTLGGATTATVSFAAPEVTKAQVLGGANLAVLQVVASDGSLSATARVTVTIVDVNRAPTATAGPDVVAVERANATVTVTAGDPDGDPTTVSWSQVSGVPLNLGAGAGASLTLTVPEVTAAQVTSGANLAVLRATVSDGSLLSSVDVTLTITDVNRPPGLSLADVSVDERTTFTLDGGVSDPDGDAVTVAWQQVSGPTVDLSGATGPRPTLTAPHVTRAQVAAGDNKAVLRATASDGAVTATADCTVTVGTVNHVPTVQLSGAGTFVEASPVSLGGTAKDPDGDPLTYAWTQTAGPQVSLSATNVASVSFAAPRVAAPTTLTFELVVSDGLLEARASANVVVTPGNAAPTARPGEPRAVSAGDVVTLDGTGSSDPEGATLTFAWGVDSGPAVSLADAHAASTSFTAPAVTTPTDLVVRLTVADPQGANGTATVVITVNPVTNPAQGCSCATGSGSDALGLLLALGLVLSRRRASGR